MNKFIPVNTPLLNGNEEKYLRECIQAGWISSEGPFVDRFEREFACKVDRKHAIAVTNGTAALDVAIAALDIGPGDEVILPAFTIISCILQIVRSGATPVLVDCDPYSWNMAVEKVEQVITHKTKAIMAVHIYGMPVDMNPLWDLSKKYNIPILEDSAQAHGQKYYDKKCGNLGLISTFSFYPNKLVTTGEGGMVVTDDDQIAERCRSLRNLCFIPGRRFIHEELGWNLRMTNIQAAIGVAQLERMDEFLLRKRRAGTLYTKLLSDIDCIQLPLKQTDYAKNAYWVYGVVLKDDKFGDASVIMNRLQENGIGTRPFFFPMNKQPALIKQGFFKDISMPISENISEMGLYLPSGVGVDDEDIERVCKSLRSALKKC